MSARNLKAFAMRLEGRRFMVVAMDFLEATRTARSIDSRVQYAGLIASLPGVYTHPLRAPQPAYSSSLEALETDALGGGQ